MGTLRTIKEQSDGSFVVQVWDDETGAELASWQFAKHLAVQMREQFEGAAEHEQVVAHLVNLANTPRHVGMIARLRLALSRVTESANPFWRFW